MSTPANGDSPAESERDDRLDGLFQLTHKIGNDPEFVILAEGNTSALLDDGTFLCTTSGSRLATVGERDVVRLRLAPLLDSVRQTGDCDVPSLMREARYDGGAGAAPSIETFVHVVCLGLGGGVFVAHTHPTQLLGLLCAPAAQQILTAGPLFPDEAVVCGRAPLYVDYHPPGIELGRALAARMETYLQTYGEPPRVIFLANHGLVAVGRSASEALAITQMATKAARVRAIALVTGELRPLHAADVSGLVTRTDELDRRELLAREAT
jgi:rhamnose utilization protein RhaD (predicted bifunctional aldolase and dehydrogenase)